MIKLIELSMNSRQYQVVIGILIRSFIAAGFQGSNTSNPFWDFVAGILKDPSPEQEACHAPKPILLDTGEVGWHRNFFPGQNCFENISYSIKFIPWPPMKTSA